MQDLNMKGSVREKKEKKEKTKKRTLRDSIIQYLSMV